MHQWGCLPLVDAESVSAQVEDHLLKKTENSDGGGVAFAVVWMVDLDADHGNVEERG